MTRTRTFLTMTRPYQTESTSQLLDLISWLTERAILLDEEHTEAMWNAITELSNRAYDGTGQDELVWEHLSRAADLLRAIIPWADPVMPATQEATAWLEAVAPEGAIRVRFVELTEVRPDANAGETAAAVPPTSHLPPHMLCMGSGLPVEDAEAHWAHEPGCTALGGGGICHCSEPHHPSCCPQCEDGACQ